MINMSKSKEIQRFEDRLASYGGNSSDSMAISEKILGLWSKFGDKKYVGKKGKKFIENSLQELYVAIGSCSDRMDELRSAVKRRLENGEKESEPLMIRARDNMNSEEEKKRGLEEKYRFLSMLKSIGDIAGNKDSKLMKSFDKMLKKNSNLDQYRETMKNSMKDHERVMSRMDDVQTYMEAMVADITEAKLKLNENRHEIDSMESNTEEEGLSDTEVL